MALLANFLFGLGFFNSVYRRCNAYNTHNKKG